MGIIIEVVFLTNAKMRYSKGYDINNNEFERRLIEINTNDLGKM